MENLKLNLQLKKAPLAFIKIQTTGLDSKTDRIVELSIQKVGLDGKIQPGGRLINPEISISAESTKIHGITNEMVKTCPTFKEIAPKLEKFLEGCDFAGFNINYFDLKFLSEEFNRAGVEFTLLKRKVVDLSHIYHAMEPRDLSAAYKFYCNKTAEKPNSIAVTAMYFEIFNSMMEKYAGQEIVDKKGVTKKIEADVDSINSMFNKNRKFLDIDGMIELNDSNIPVFTRGKCGPNKEKKTPGQSVAEACLSDSQYFDWIINVSTFNPDTKLVIKKIVEKAKEKAAKASAPATQ